MYNFQANLRRPALFCVSILVSVACFGTSSSDVCDSTKAKEAGIDPVCGTWSYLSRDGEDKVRQRYIPMVEVCEADLLDESKKLHVGMTCGQDSLDFGTIVIPEGYAVRSLQSRAIHDFGLSMYNLSREECFFYDSYELATVKGELKNVEFVRAKDTVGKPQHIVSPMDPKGTGLIMWEATPKEQRIRKDCIDANLQRGPERVERAVLFNLEAIRTSSAPEEEPVAYLRRHFAEIKPRIANRAFESECEKQMVLKELNATRPSVGFGVSWTTVEFVVEIEMPDGSTISRETTGCTYLFGA